MNQEDGVVNKMSALITHWEACSDQRLIFLSCYRLMTENMLAALGQEEFLDRIWVKNLLDHFATYYFDALDAYERAPADAPAAWQLAYLQAAHPNSPALQNLLLGVNAHINYDLAQAVTDLLAPEWATLSEQRREERYADYCRVNQIISQTIDAVQDQILDPSFPLLRIVDTVMGPLDEMLISRLIVAWRDTVWRSALRMLEADSLELREKIVAEMETEALRTGHLIVFAAKSRVKGEEMHWGKPQHPLSAE